MRAIKMYSVKSYQQYLEKLGTVRKAAADFELNNSFSREAHELIAKQYAEDIEKLSMKVQEYHELIENIVADEAEEDEKQLVEYLSTLRKPKEVVEAVKEDGGNV